MSNDIAAEEPLRLRWEKETRYYEIHLQQDLWGSWVLTRIWGRRGSPMGQVRRAPFECYAEAMKQLTAVQSQRKRRGYEPVMI
ncbi:WGR domain-containing protein [Methylocaldum szegediense]|uniref:WGR domain-containing protein n=1 Tax=Methylocaldum szegediense TaxID=73780 RepID=A0ABM9I9U4_9GAMM|nr:WGR domain-containing protein [Methylocaldum szegediense]CAI8982354.1 WGR domain-containing protein [Methylocaldum szegediense]